MTTLAQKDADLINVRALRKVKKEKLGLKAKEELDAYNRETRGKFEEQLKIVTKKNNAERQNHTIEAIRTFKQDCLDIENKTKEKRMKEREVS